MQTTQQAFSNLKKNPTIDIIEKNVDKNYIRNRDQLINGLDNLCNEGYIYECDGEYFLNDN